ncbi:MAG: MDR/zinc-dependent alcohol dehydrogenase-like family protein [Desulfosalsimonas sp.]
MKALRISDGRLDTVEVPIPQPENGQALVKVLKAGICGTDLEMLKGYAGFTGTPGHEFVGTVESAPGLPGLCGQRVAADINCGCGKCSWCKFGDPRHCSKRSVIGIRGKNGAFAEYLTVPVKNLYPVADSIDDIRAVFAEPLAAALEIAQQVHVRNSDRILVLGDGRLGLLAAAALKHYTGNLVIAGRHPEKLSVAEKMGVKTVESGAPPPEGGFDLVVEATGSPEGIQTALDLVRAEGTVIVKTTTAGQSSLDLSSVVVNEITVTGSRCGDIGLALRFLEHGWVDPHPLVEKVYPFSSAKEAFRHAQSRGSLKIILDISE